MIYAARFTVFFVSVLAATAAHAQFQPTGLRLGVTTFPNSLGLRVVSVTPGTPAYGLFRPDDVLTRASDQRTILQIRTHQQLEQVKSLAGLQWFIIEAHRPGVGYFYTWVQLQPLGGIQENSLPANRQINLQRTARPRTSAAKTFQNLLNRQGRR